MDLLTGLRAANHVLAIACFLRSRGSQGGVIPKGLWISAFLLLPSSLAFSLCLAIRPSWRRKGTSTQSGFSDAAAIGAFLPCAQLLPLIESIEGVETLKATHAEGSMLRRWEDFSAQLAASSLKTKKLSNIAGNSVSLISQLTTVV